MLHAGRSARPDTSASGSVATKPRVASSKSRRSVNGNLFATSELARSVDGWAGFDSTFLVNKVFHCSYIFGNFLLQSFDRSLVGILKAMAFKVELSLLPSITMIATCVISFLKKLQNSGIGVCRVWNIQAQIHGGNRCNKYCGEKLIANYYPKFRTEISKPLRFSEVRQPATQEKMLLRSHGISFRGIRMEFYNVGRLALPKIFEEEKAPYVCNNIIS